jgi:hypothetical protein
MKNITYILFTAAVIFSGCLKDKGNYTLTEINRVNIENLGAEYFGNYGDTLKITPTLSFTKDAVGDTSNYTYNWMIDKEIGRTSRSQQMGTSFALAYKVTTAYGYYSCYYRVTDKRTGVFTDHYFNLRIGGKAYEGWMFLTDPGDGTSRLDMTAATLNADTLYRDILGLSRSAFPTNAPASFIASGVGGLHIPPATGGMFFIIGTHEKAASLGLDTLQYEPVKYDVNSLISSNPITSFAGAKMVLGRYCGLLFAENNVRTIGLGSLSAPVNRMPAATELFKAAPFMGFVNGLSTSNAAVLFNEDTKTFVRYPGSGNNCLVMPVGALFPYNINMNLVYMQWVSYNGGEVFAILKDAAGKFRLARFNMDGTSQRFYAEMNATDIDKATSFAVSNELGYVFYNVDGKVYEYDLFLNASKLMQDYGNRKISMLKFQTFSLNFSGQVNQAKYVELGKKLVVASYDPANLSTSGKVDLFTVPDINRPLELFKSYEGTGRVVSIAYRDR